MSISEFLKGAELKYESVQNINGLMIAPLVLEDDMLQLKDRFEVPKLHSNYKVSTSNYGIVNIENTSDKDVLVLPHEGYVTSKTAQDHLISKATLVRGRSSKTLTDSRCVQSNQGGYISRNDSSLKKYIAPLSLREAAYENEGYDGYDRLWDYIDELNISTSTSSSGGSNLKDYFNKYTDKLAQFIGHFEDIKGCIGYIVFYDGEIVAIDKFPEYKYTKEVFKTMVRDCYGSLVIEALSNNSTPKNPIKKSRKRSPISFMGETYNNTINSQKELIRERLMDLMEVNLEVKNTENESTTYDSEGYLAQSINVDGFNAAFFLIKKGKFNPESFRKAHELRNKERSKSSFKF